MIMKSILALALAALLSGCSLMGMGGDVLKPHPDWAQDAWERQQDSGSAD